MKRGDEFRSLGSDAEVFAVTLDQAIELFKQEKKGRRQTARRTVLREVGAHPESGAKIEVLEGRYGPYVADGTTNASLPKDMAIEALTLEEAVGLLKAREGAPSKKGRGRAPAKRTGAAAPRKRAAKRSA